MKTLLFLAVAGGLHAGCIAVPSEKILAGDLAAAVPLFQVLDPDAVIGYAPLPGTQRVFSSHDVLLVARRYGLSLPAAGPPPSFCIERLVRPLSSDDVRAAVLAAFGASERSEMTLDVISFSNQPLPPGRLVFARAALNKPLANNAQTPVVWPGKLIYADQSSLSIWAKVRISIDGEEFVAKQDIPRGEIIGAGQITATHVQQFPALESPPWSASEIVGKAARRTIAAGQKIRPDALETPKAVIQGETVRVRVVDGAATITLEGVAQSSGIKGDRILVHNPSSGKSFRAVIEDRGQVVVVSPTESAPAASLRSDPSSISNL